MSPEVIEAAGGELGVKGGMLDIAVPEVVLDGACVLAVVGELKGRFSQIGEPICDHKNARGDQKGIDDFPQGRARQIETIAGEAFGLTVERQVVVVLGDDDLGQQAIVRELDRLELLVQQIKAVAADRRAPRITSRARRYYWL